jgi:hypothetical protein
MKISGWIFLALSWSFIIIMMVWSFAVVLSKGEKK